VKGSWNVISVGARRANGVSLSLIALGNVSIYPKVCTEKVLRYPFTYVIRAAF
jgi:hypothetical protein